MAKPKFKSRIKYSSYLNELGIPEDDLYSNGGRIPDRTQFYGKWLRKNDPIAYEVGYQDWKRETDGKEVVKLPDPLEVLDEVGNRIAYCIDLWEIPEEAAAMLRGEINAINETLHAHNYIAPDDRT